MWEGDNSWKKLKVQAVLKGVVELMMKGKEDGSKSGRSCHLYSIFVEECPFIVYEMYLTLQNVSKLHTYGEDVEGICSIEERTNQGTSCSWLTAYNGGHQGSVLGARKHVSRRGSYCVLGTNADVSHLHDAKPLWLALSKVTNDIAPPS